MAIIMLFWKNEATSWQLEPSPFTFHSMITPPGSKDPDDEGLVETHPSGEISGLIFRNELYEKVLE